MYLEKMKIKHFDKIFLAIVFAFYAVACFAQAKGDTLVVQGKDLELKNLKTGNSTYIVYNKKTKESPAEKIVLVKIKTERATRDNKPAFAVTQQWDSDGAIVHTAYTVFDSKDFSTLFHDTYWKRLGYSTKFDFEAKKVAFDGNVSDGDKQKSEQDFNDSFNKYNLNWHSDLIIFTLLPYKENRNFKINFYDPGFGKAQEVLYSVTGSDWLTDSAGEKIECWILENKFTLNGGGYQRFWISKKKHEVLKEEDSFNNTFRYKLKLEVSEDN